MLVCWHARLVPYNETTKVIISESRMKFSEMLNLYIYRDKVAFLSDRFKFCWVNTSYSKTMSYTIKHEELTAGTIKRTLRPSKARQL